MIQNKWFGVLLSLTLLKTAAMAEIDDIFSISVGSMFVSTFETELQLAKEGVPLGATVNTKDQLGLENDTSVFRLDGYYRFTPKHSIEYSYYSVRSSGNKFVDKTFEFNGNTLSDVQVNSHFNMNIYKLNYAYSFYHNEDVELALTAGLHVTQVDVGFSAQGKVNGEDNKTSTSSFQVPAPLPVIGFKGEYTIIRDTLFVDYKAEYLFVEYDNYRGVFFNSMLDLEYRFLDNYGVGAGFNINDLKLTADNGSERLKVENKLSGVMVYFTYNY